MPYRCGLCCISLEQKRLGYSFQTMTWTRFCQLGDKAIETLCERYANNLIVLQRVIEQCGKRGWCYRISSDLFPLLTHPDADIIWEDLPNVSTLNHLFDQAAESAKAGKVRLSCHPDQFNVLCSLSEKAVKSTIKELNHHGWIMTRMGSPLNHESPINIHINSSKGDCSYLASLFKERFEMLNDDARCRLVVENEDKGIWNARNLLKHIHDGVGIPLTYDNLHHICNNDGMSQEEAFKGFYGTWGEIKPIFHYCESFPIQPNKRKHAEYPLELPEDFGHDIDFDIELKGKDDAISSIEEMHKNRQ